MSQDDDKPEEHESYAVVRFNRRTGNPGRLFGSALKTHEAFVTLSVARAKLYNQYGHERYHASLRGDLVEVDMSAAQFAELLTTMNVGVGVPCTLRYFDAKKVESPPDTPVEMERVRETFRREVNEHVKDMKKEQVGLQNLLAKPSIGKADREQISRMFASMLRKYEDSAPFMLNQFEEATEKVVQHAKAEVDAFLTNNIIAEGIQAVKARIKEKALTTEVQGLLPEKKKE